MMSQRFLTPAGLIGLAIGVSLLVPAVLNGQSPSVAAQTGASASGWTPPRTPDGQPDLQGLWSSLTTTPLQRPEKYAGKPFLTEEEDGTEGGVDGRGTRADNPEDRRLSERCLTFGVPRFPGGYNNNFQIVQTPDHVVIQMFEYACHEGNYGLEGQLRSARAADRLRTR